MMDTAKFLELCSDLGKGCGRSCHVHLLTGMVCLTSQLLPRFVLLQRRMMLEKKDIAHGHLL